MHVMVGYDLSRAKLYNTYKLANAFLNTQTDTNACAFILHIYL